MWGSRSSRGEAAEPIAARSSPGRPPQPPGPGCSPSCKTLDQHTARHRAQELARLRGAGAGGLAYEPMTDASISRRALLAGAAGALGSDALRRAGLAQTPDPTKVPGQPTSALGQRSPFERPRRIPSGSGQGISLTPLQDLCGIVTPADLHFERHHAGVPTIDPQRYKLLIHGMVERPMVFDLAALKRFPAVSLEGGEIEYHGPLDHPVDQQLLPLRADGHEPKWVRPPH